MRITKENMEVFLRSENIENPYPPDGKDQLGHGLYCETVIGDDSELSIDNSLHSKTWQDNPDVKLDMIAYYACRLKIPMAAFLELYVLWMIRPWQILKNTETYSNNFAAL